MAPSGTPTAALGEEKWVQSGGKVLRCKHPSGRISLTYVSPAGDKFRSWKQCLSYLEGGVRSVSASPPIEAQQGNGVLKKSPKRILNGPSPSPREWTIKRKSLSNKNSLLAKGINCDNSSEDDSQPEAEPRVKHKGLHCSFLDPLPPASPDTTAGRRQSLQNSQCGRLVSPSTFTGVNMPGRYPSAGALAGGSLSRSLFVDSPSRSSSEDDEHRTADKSVKSDRAFRAQQTRKRALTPAGAKRVEKLRNKQIERMRKEATAVAKPLTRKSSPDFVSEDGFSVSGETSPPVVRLSIDEEECVKLPHSTNGNGNVMKPVEFVNEKGSKHEQKQGRKRTNEEPMSGPSVIRKKTTEDIGTNAVVTLSDDDDLGPVPDREAAISRPKRAAAGSNFKEKHISLDETNAVIEVKQTNREAVEEDVALVLTAQSGEEFPPERKLIDITIHDEQGIHRPIELLEICALYVTGMVLPNTDPIDKARGSYCESLGPLTSWSIVGYEKSSPGLVLCTDLAEYFVVKPSVAYRKIFNILFDKARVCVEVYRSLSKPEGGDPRLQVDELIARISRSFSKQGSSGNFFSREFCLNNGEFIVAQLTGLDKSADDKEQLFSGLPALISLEEEGRRRNPNSLTPGHVASGGGALKIGDVGSSANQDLPVGNDSMNEDEKLARLLQDEVDRTNSKPIRTASNSKGKFYIKINEKEIATDYPLPAYFKAEEEETDEYLLFDDAPEDPDDLPHRKLHDWTLYNSDSRLVSLELLPMLPEAETDTEIFGSGIITEDDGSGFCLDSNENGGGSSGGVVLNGRSSEEGIRVYLSAVKEWKIEFGASMIFISLRTDGAWYRLGKPSQQYTEWYEPVLRTARIAVKIITMLNEELRINRLSLLDIIKRLTDQPRDAPTFLPGKAPDVERYIIVHSQIILQQFAEYPDERIRKSAFITGLAAKMEECSHTKLNLIKKKVELKKGKNLNPRATLCPDGNKRKPMRATTTRLVDRIWSAYYAGAEEGLDKAAEVPGNDLVEEELAEESDDEETVVEVKPSSVKEAPQSKRKPSEEARPQVQWVGQSTEKTSKNEQVFGKAIVQGAEYTAGKAVFVDLDDRDEQPDQMPIVLIEYLYESRRHGAMFHGRVLQRGIETILGNAANEREVFLTDGCVDVEIVKITGVVNLEMRSRNWGHAYRKVNYDLDKADSDSALENAKKGKPKEYFCRSWYSPDRGAFFSLPLENLALGVGTCKACETQQKNEESFEVQIIAQNEGFRFEGVDYLVNDYLFLDPDTFERESNDPSSKVLFKGGRNKGLRAFAVCQLLSVLPSLNGNSKKVSHLMKVRRFFRPEDVDKLKAYRADIHEVYYSEVTATVDISTVRGKCLVRRQVLDGVASATECALNHVFYCDLLHDPKTGAVKQLPPNIRLTSSSSLETSAGKTPADERAMKAKGKGKAVEDDMVIETPSGSALSTLDIFAGCGGLSEGLHQSGAAETKWAIEYDFPASEAFKLNHPTAEVFCDNCNVILRSIMEVGGDLDDCVSTPQADELSLKLGEERKCKLPKPGEVDFISGGPPCQGFSGMNRFNQRAWSKVQCEMILSFLSYADYFRPRYFLLENVRNFVSFNKGQTFRLSLTSLLEMGYQVRFGVLQAGNYGVAQSRKRAFIWAAAPQETLPEWPEPRHVFSTSQIGIAMPNGSQFAAVRDAARGAPLRSITVRDTIGDLPPVENGANVEKLDYINNPVSWFQSQIRGGETQLVDHIAKEMNELNVIRCQRIPKVPGADWRALPEEKVKLSTGQTVDLIPWCLPNTAARHNQWKGLFGRLDLDGNFPTSITDPQPMGKVGMCFHPEQDRIVTVRECARSQGFPDRYKFYGNINSKHRQIGNAVPPPLARALGLMLKDAANKRQT